MGRKPKEPKKLDDKFLFGGDKLPDKDIVSDKKDVSDKPKATGSGHVAKRPILHNGKRYAVGDLLDEISEGEAVSLRQSEAI